MKCREVMQSHVFRLQQTSTAAQAAHLMRDANIGFIAVTDAADGVVGVITDRDLAVRLVAENRAATTPLAELMTPAPLVGFAIDEDVEPVKARMAAAKVWRALSLDGHRHCVGVISVVDLAHAEQAQATQRKLHASSMRF